MHAAPKNPTREARIAGALLGTAVGDTLGLPFEGMSRRRVRATLGEGPLSHRFVLGRGMMSDDTEHACMVARALIESGGEPAAFAHSLASKLRWWLVGLPAGIGFGTLRGILKLWLGFGPEQSGVHSAGNGPAMRAPLLGAYAAHDPNARCRLVRASTRLTHTDPRAEHGALAVAHAAALPASAHQQSPATRLAQVRDALPRSEMAQLVDQAIPFAHAPSEAFANSLGLQKGVTGFVNHTVPVALHCWARHPSDLEAAVSEVVRLGGDTDTTAAIVAGLVGATAGPTSIPTPWLEGIAEWPQSISYLKTLATSLARAEPAPPLFWPALALRNALFTAGVFALILKRALPPW